MVRENGKKFTKSFSLSSASSCRRRDLLLPRGGRRARNAARGRRAGSHRRGSSGRRSRTCCFGFLGFERKRSRLEESVKGGEIHRDGEEEEEEKTNSFRTPNSLSLQEFQSETHHIRLAIPVPTTLCHRAGLWSVTPSKVTP